MQIIRDLLNSKKFITAILGVITQVALLLGVPEVTIGEMTAVISPFLAYIGAQGFADGRAS